MKTLIYTYEEMIQFEKENKNNPIKQRWFKHKTKPNHYQKQINILELNDFIEVKL